MMPLVTLGLGTGRRQRGGGRAAGAALGCVGVLLGCDGGKRDWLLGEGAECCVERPQSHSTSEESSGRAGSVAVAPGGEHSSRLLEQREMPPAGTALAVVYPEQG